MHRIPLAEFLKTHTQAEAAAAIGVTQGAISKAVREKRQIFLVPQGDGTYKAIEEKPIGSAA